MHEHLKGLSLTLQDTTKTELLLNERSRELAKVKLENAQLKCRIEYLEKFNQKLNNDSKDFKMQYQSAKEVEQQHNLKLIQNQNLIQSLNKKIEILEKTLEIYKDPAQND